MPCEILFTTGDRVMKVRGDYHISGEIRSIFTKANGETRIVVEHQAEGGGSFLHIYNPSQLERIIPADTPVE